VAAELPGPLAEAVRQQLGQVQLGAFDPLALSSRCHETIEVRRVGPLHDGCAPPPPPCSASSALHCASWILCLLREFGPVLCARCTGVWVEDSTPC
jgi:hypothetical protein